MKTRKIGGDEEAETSSSEKKPLQRIKVGAQPIAWSNDDFHDLGGTISLTQCLSDMREAGYVGTELGHKFPREATALRNVLQQHDLELISGWYSSYLLSRDFAQEKAAFLEHCQLLRTLGCPVVIVAECTGRIYDQPVVPLQLAPTRVAAIDWEKLATGLNELGELALSMNLRLVYHHHVGTVVQSLPEIMRLMAMTDPQRVFLLADTGHLAFAGIPPLSVFQQFAPRIAHVHLKDIRLAVVEKVHRESLSFYAAVCAGVFTVPGDGAIDYPPIFACLAQAAFQGWWVVEAEQDPALAPPFAYAQRARQFINQWAGI